ncbi:Deoxyribonuclease TatD [Pseudoalteromonas luteoviolacea B = ATCC 29581]|nr:Deoxyribonuclease TatD [Pseudoalteromonas luteoviolacea B = ATCC 29581]
MSASWVDIAVNLTNAQFNDDACDVVEHAKRAGVEHMLLVGCDLESSKQSLDYAERWDLFATAGVHPHDAKDVVQDYLVQLTDLHNHSKAIAVGECGLDFNRDFSPRQVQQHVLSEQLALAESLNKPVYLHEREASETLLSILKEHKVRGILHCFTGNQQALEAYLDYGLHIGVTGWVCDERRGQELQTLVPIIPDDRLHLETDAPFLIPRTLTPKPKHRRNEPAFLIAVAQQVARLRGAELPTLKLQCYRNFKTLFGVDNND